MDTKHTLGPLEVGESDTFGVRVRQAVAHAHPQSRSLGVAMEVKHRVALVYECEPGSAKAYATLFAAAPELLELLAAIWHEYDQTYDGTETFGRIPVALLDRAKELLAKARP